MQLTINDLAAAGACKKGLNFFEEKFSGAATEQELISFIQKNDIPYEMLFWCLDNLVIKEEILSILIKKCNIVNTETWYKSYNVINSSKIFNSHNISNSCDVSYSSDINNSTLVLNSKDVEDSKNIYNSDFVTNSSKVLKSQNIYSSENIVSTSYADNSKNINLGKNIINSNTIYNSENITDSYFCGNCSNLSNCLFCYDLKDKEYCIFNKSVSNQQFTSIRNFLLRFLPIEINYVKWQDETEINVSNVKDTLKIIEWYKHLPERLITWIKTLPHYDPLIMYKMTILYCFLEDIT